MNYLTIVYYIKNINDFWVHKKGEFMIAKVGSKEVFFDLPFENDPKITNSILTIND